MIKKTVLFLCIMASALAAQTSPTDKEFRAKPVGGDEQLEHVLQTQLTLPKVLLTHYFEEQVIAFFDLDSAGNATNIKFDKGINNALRAELTRMFRFLKFQRTLNLPGESRPYFLGFDVSTEKYNRYYKQKYKLNLKKQVADSSYTVYSRADRSPEYYKNGEEGLTELLLSEMEYPRMALDRSIEGTVILEFVVETNGYITNLVAKQGVNGGCTEEALRLIKDTRWQPAVLNNKLVRYKMTYPVTFNLRAAKGSNLNTMSTIGQ